MKKILLLLILVISFSMGVEVSAIDTSISIGLIDTGVSNHNELIDMSKILEGKNYAFDNDDTTDLIGHGTAIASIILGTVDGNIVPSVEKVNIVPLVYYSKYQSGVIVNGGVDAITDAIYDAIDVYGCKVINISSGTSYDDEDLRTAIEYAEEMNVIVVSSVGNANLTNESLVYYPASYETVIGVGSADGDNVAAFSQRGESVYVLADGTNLLVAGIKNAEVYKNVSGSSYSAAYVTALAASLLQENPNMTAEEFRTVLKYSSTDICDIGYDTSSGYGIINKEYAFEVIENIDEIMLFSVETEPLLVSLYNFPPKRVK